jgi:hypothetical protein
MTAVVVLLGACSGGEDSASTTTTTTTAAAGQSEFCGIAEELGPELDQSEDFSAVVAGVEQLAAAAPEEIDGDLEGLGRLVDLASDPEVAAASGNVDAFVTDECGVELGWSTDTGSDEVARP